MNRRIGLVILAVVLALGGTLAVYSYAHNADQRAIANTRAAHVLIVEKAVPAGTSWSDAVKGGYFSEQKVPVKSAPTTAVSGLSGLVPLDEVATAVIQSGQIVVREMFGSKTPATGIVPIPKGLMAVSVTLPANADVAGFVQNGSEVAIFHTFKISGPRLNKPPKIIVGAPDLFSTKMLLPRVSVVATSQDAPSDLNGAKGTSNASSTNVLVTLALSQKDAERLILAQQTGQLYLALLSESSITTTDDGVINLGDFKPVPIYVK
jgi:pilus assembly protein CpaB